MAETLGSRLRKIRGSQSQADFASKIGVGKTLLGKYERDESVPGGDILRQMHKATGVNITWLLTGQGPMYAADQAVGEPRSTRGLPPLDPILYGRVTEAVAAVYKEFGYTLALHQIGAEAARIAAELAEVEFTEEERTGVIKGAMAQLRRQLKDAAAGPDGEAASKHEA